MPAVVSYDMPRPVEGFIGRTKLLNTLATLFGALDPSDERETKETKGTKENKSSTTTSPRKLVLCTGLGGVGKTQLALQYAHTATKHYQHQFWFAADHPDTLNAGYRLFAKEKSLIDENYVPDKDIIKAVNQWLASHSNWLIIYDNVERYQEVAPYLPTQGAGDILLTSRSAPTRWPKSVTAVVVDVLSPAEASRLIASLIDTPDDPDIPALATLLGCLPLALVQACAYIRENSIPVAAYLKAYEARAKHLLQQPATPADFPRHDPVFVTWDISLDAIANEEKAKGKQVSAKELLQFCAFLGPQKIPSRIIETWHTQTYPATDELFTEARSRLHAYSLAQLDPADQSIQVHRLVQQVMREQLSAQAQTAQLQKTIKLLTDAYPQEDVGVGKAWDAIRFGFIPHLETVIAYHAQYKLKEDVTLSLALSPLADAYGDLGQAGKQRELLERALAIDEAHYGQNHYQVAKTLGNLGNAYGELGDIGKKRDLLERVLAIQEARYGKDHYQVAITLMNLGTAYGDLGDVSKQQALLERSLAIDEAHYGKEHYQVATTLVNLSNVYSKRREVGKQRELLERALPILETHYGRDHYKVASTLVNLGIAYGDLGDVGKQRELLERALAIDEAHYGPEHYVVAGALMGLGHAYFRLKEFSKAQGLFEHALQIKEEHYGPTHPELASTLTNLAITYQGLEQPQVALHAAQRAYRILMDHPDYGAEHPKTKQCLQPLRLIEESGRNRTLIDRIHKLKHKLKSEGHSHSKLNKEQDEMDKQILGVENELQRVRNKQSERRDNQNWTALFEEALTLRPKANTYGEYALFFYLKGIEQPSQREELNQAIVQATQALFAEQDGGLSYSWVERDTVPPCLRSLLDTPQATFEISSTLLAQYVLVSSYCHLNQWPEAQVALEGLAEAARTQKTPIADRLLAAAKAELTAGAASVKAVVAVDEAKAQDPNSIHFKPPLDPPAPKAVPFIAIPQANLVGEIKALPAIVPLNQSDTIAATFDTNPAMMRDSKAEGSQQKDTLLTPPLLSPLPQGDLVAPTTTALPNSFSSPAVMQKSSQPVAPHAQFFPPVTTKSREIKNQSQKEDPLSVNSLLKKVYELIDVIYPLNDQVSRDVRKSYIRQLAKYKKSGYVLTSEDQITLEQLQKKLLQQQSEKNHSGCVVS